MTFEEVRDLILPDLATIYIVTVNDDTTYRGLIEGPYRGYRQGPLENRREDYIYIKTLSSGLLESILITCSIIKTINVAE
jgi:hypothetical protein